MTIAHSYPSDNTTFQAIMSQIKGVVDVGRRLPDWPFKAAVGIADFCQYSPGIEGPFSPVLEGLVDVYKDDVISLVAIEPSPNYYRQNYGCYPAFTLPAPRIARAYWEAVSYEPGGDPTGSITESADVFCITGSSGAWAVWGERFWDLSIVLSQHKRGPWTSAGLEFVSAEEALANFTEPDFKVPLPKEVRARFLENVAARGSLT